MAGHGVYSCNIRLWVVEARKSGIKGHFGHIAGKRSKAFQETYSFSLSPIFGRQRQGDEFQVSCTQ